MRYVYLDVCSLALDFYTPTEIAIIGIIVSDFYGAIVMKNLLEYASDNNLLYIKPLIITNFINKSVKNNIATYESGIDEYGNVIEPEFAFNLSFLNNYTKVVIVEG